MTGSVGPSGSVSTLSSDRQMNRQKRRVNRPALYRSLKRLHFWLTTITALPLAIMSITGALLVFGQEWEAALWPELREVSATDQGLAPYSYDRIAAVLARDHPQLRVWAYTPSKRPDQAWVLWLAANAGILNVDPATGKTLLHYRAYETPADVVRGLHRFLMAHPSIRPWVRHLLSATALLLTLQILVGIALWAVPPKPWRNLKVSFRSGARLGVLRLHQTAGLVTALFLIIIAVTGISMHWTAPTRAILEALLGQTVQMSPDPDQFSDLAPLGSLDEAVALAQARFPNARVSGVRPPAQPGNAMVVSFDQPDAWVSGSVVVGDHPPRILTIYDGRTANLATIIWTLRYSVHLGHFADGSRAEVPVRLLWLVLALAPLGFAGSGLWLHSRRRRQAR